MTGLLGRRASQPPENLPGALVLFVGVGVHEVEVELIEEGLCQKVRAAGEGFQIKELVLDEPMHGLDLAVVGMGGGRDADVLAVAQVRGKAGGTALGVVAAHELFALVGLPDQVAEVDPVAGQVALDAGGETTLVPAVRRWAKAQKNKSLRTSRAVYWIGGKRSGWACCQ